MAYYGYEFFYDGTRAAFWGYIQTALVNMGWELHDSISATVKVYKSNGESGNEPYGYIWIDAGTSTYIQFAAYQYWDNSAHTGLRQRYPNDYIGNGRITSNFFVTDTPGGIFGDKNIVMIIGDINCVNSSQGGIIFGHIPVRFDNNLIQAQGTAGTAGTITIAPSSYLGNGKSVQIVGNTGEGCDSLSISSAPDSSTRIVVKLPRNYGTGSVVGAPASVFCITYLYTAYVYPVSTWGDVGNTVTTSYLTAYRLASPDLSQYEYYINKKYYLVPIYIASLSASAPGQILGSLGENILSGFSIAYAMNSALCNDDGSVPDVSLAGLVKASSLYDASKSWGVNAHAGRFCVITEGDGAGIVKRILSNTSNELTLDSSWPSTYYPRAGSVYRIADKVYRIMVGIFQFATYLKISRTDVPS